MVNKDESPGQSVNKPVAFKQDAIFITAVGLAYFLAYQIAFLFPDANKVLMEVWPASGIGLGALLLGRRRVWPAILTTLMLTASVANLLDGRPSLACLGYMASNLIETLGCALLMIRLCGKERIQFTEVKQVAALFICAIAVNAFTASIGAGMALLVSPAASFWRLWRTWWICKGLGIFLVTPFVVVWGEWREMIVRTRRMRVAEIILFIIVWTCLSWYAFRPDSIKLTFLPRPHLYMLMALMAWPALRFGRALTTVSLLLLAAIAITGALVQGSPFWITGEDTAGRLLSVEIYLAIVSLVGLLLTTSQLEGRSSRRRAEEERARLAALTNNLPNAAIYQLVRNHDGTLRIAYFSEGLERLTGISAEAALGKSAHIYDQIAGEDRKTLYALHRTSLESMSSIHGEIRLRHTDGSVRWMNVSSTPRPLDDGRVAWDGLMMDVTESKGLTQSLAASEEKYRALFHSSDFGMLVTRVDGSEILEVNATLCTMLGYAPGELLGQPSKCIWADPRERDEMIRLLKRDGFVHAFECRLATKTGAIVWCITSLHAPGSDGIIHGSIINITDRKKTEDALVQSEEKYRTIVENITDQLIIHDFDGQILDVNESAAAMLGYSRDELVGARLEKIMPPRQSSLIPERIGWMRERDTLEFESVRLRKDGSTFLCEVRCKVVSREGRGVIQSFWRDITDLRRMQEMAAKNDRLESIGVLAGGIAHDFNNLLGRMYGYIEMAQMQLEGSGNEKPLEYLDKALGIFERTRDLTRQLLTFAKGGSPVKKAGSLEAVVRGNAEFMLTGTPVTCTFSIPEPLWTCEFDENMIGQVIDNMVINAQQAMPEGGIVAIELRNVDLRAEEIPLLKKGSYVRISIRDSGRGIPADVLPKIFDPFFTTKLTGSGLGLATCYSVIKKHKGIITVESGEGAGTAFHIFLPAAPSNAVAAVPDAPASGDTEQGDRRMSVNRVLIMDDEEYMREVVGTMLATLGCTFVGVSNGNEALERIQEARDRQQPFDAVIMDLTIPGGMGGRETIGKLRIIDKTILAIAMSGYSEDPVMADPQRFGFDGCLAKPLRKADLERELRRGRA